MADKTTPAQSITAPTPKAISVQPPKMEGRGKTPIHSPEVIAEIASAAAKGWTSNGLTYKTKSGADGARQAVKSAILEAGLAANSKDLTTRVWEQEPGVFVFAIAATSAVR